ncbi:hypothetical protein M407DRAFT_7205 [Tulasnella calospora MUT 4182]|uniref:Ubiquitin-like protease family profile domain-containing protein n=1 Tax=Tulasnella calospora MUT 4182 TaxID=1051891 RepID=A0A0C3L1L2_9AGAM|nr:hypothetical protein M407DRAFT_7205 [Tulasnella calospora MUT 4182]
MCPLDYKYVAFPMNASNLHWVLGILTHASDLLVEHNPNGAIRTSLLILNSIHGYNPPDLGVRYLDFICLLSFKKPMHCGALSKVKLFKPEGELNAGESLSEFWLSSKVAQARDNLRALVDRAGIVRAASHTFHSG